MRFLFLFFIFVSSVHASEDVGEGQEVTGLSGDSGGAVLSKNNKILGVLSSTSINGFKSAKNYIVPLARPGIEKFLASIK